MKCAERVKTVHEAFFGKSNLDGLDDVGGSEVVHILYAVRKETATRLGEEECERRESVQRKKCQANLANGPADAEFVRKKRAKNRERENVEWVAGWLVHLYFPRFSAIFCILARIITYSSPYYSRLRLML